LKRFQKVVIVRLLTNSLLPMIGASGAVFGLIGLWQAWDYRVRQKLRLPLQPLVMAILALVAVNLVFFVILDGGLAWEAHLGGWLVGWVAGRSFARSSLSVA
jgi:membrane associated rhomboid family serine protease